MTIPRKFYTFLPQLKSLFGIQRCKHDLAKGGVQTQLYAEVGSNHMVLPGPVDTSKWKRVDSRTAGVTPSMISSPSWTVLKILKGEGFDAYLVGGCVRDLLLKKLPKDFDVITTANLQQIKKKFHRAQIVGRRFPICRVHVKGSVIEVSSFETVARHDKKKEGGPSLVVPKGCDEKDFICWQNSMHRDFTINSLFYDPFANKIYDYVHGMRDLTSLKLRTLIPAHLSFKEDCARILRGLRIAARLRLSFSKDAETALRSLSASVRSLDKSRLMMELNYMLSYGAAEPSLLLLRRFSLLEMLFPFQAAYLTQQYNARNPGMLMKLFFHLDKLVSCDHPCDSTLWVSLLAFHLALVNNPQDALTVWTLSSVLYHGKWKEGVKLARQYTQEDVNFVPEILCTYDLSDEELAQTVAEFAEIIQESIDVFTDVDALHRAMARYPSFPCTGLIFVSKNAGKDATKVFNMLVNNIESRRERRTSYEINYNLLGKGDIEETRFVLGKVIMDTMSSGANIDNEIKDHLCTFEQKCVEEREENHGSVTDTKTQKLEIEEQVRLSPQAVQATTSKDDYMIDLVEEKRHVSSRDPQRRGKKRKPNQKSTICVEKKEKQSMSKILDGRDVAKKKIKRSKVAVKEVKSSLSLRTEMSKRDVKSKKEPKVDHRDEDLDKSHRDQRLLSSLFK